MLKTCFRIFRRHMAAVAKMKVSPKDQVPCLCLEDSCKIRPTCGMPKVLVIGAGMAGLSAAHKLLSCGITDVTVLEACDRIGGRMMSAWIGDTLVELGCGNIGPASIANPCYNMALSMGDVLLAPKEARGAVFVTSDGRTIANFETEKHIFAHILNEASGLGKGRTSLLHFLNLRIQQEILNYPENLRYDAERVLYGMANELRQIGGGDISSISAASVGLPKTDPGPPITVKEGCITLIRHLAKDIPYQQIKEQKEVYKINWQAERGIKPRAVVCTKEGDSYEADYVIVTLPIGVLRETAEQIFSPPLPESKMTAMKMLGNGTIIKVFAEYEQPFWAGNNLDYRLAWSPSELVQQGNWVRGLTQIQAVSRTVMMFTVTGPEAAMVEENSDEEVAIELTRLIRKLTKDNSIPFPHHIIVPRWGTNKYCRGSMMHLLLDSTEDHLQELGTPVPEPSENVTPVLLFAGDMTYPKSFSRIPAARRSGLREADRILQLTNKFSGPPL